MHVVIIARTGLPSIEGLKHFLDLLLQSFDQGRLIFHPHIGGLVQVITLDRLALPFPLEKVIEEA